jgi:hypothetical protein
MAAEPRYVEVLARAAHDLQGHDGDVDNAAELAVTGSD